MGAKSVARLWALVPVKPFAEAKHRLAPALDSAARIALAQAMLARTLDILRHAPAIDGVVVVSRDPAALRVARAHGAHSLAETEPGLNPALEQASRRAVTLGARATLVVPIDLPKLTAADIVQLARLALPAPCVVLAPAARDGGTNALLLNPAGVLAYAFGPRSAARHRRRARQAGALIKLYQSNRLGFDVDVPLDLQHWPAPQR